MSRAEVDTTLLTGDIQKPGGASDKELLSDQSTIRNAVSSADVEMLGGEAIGWANAETGARGNITGLTETRRDSRLCRNFVTTRENFDGVRLFSGEACMVGAGFWRLQAFRAL